MGNKIEFEFGNIANDEKIIVTPGPFRQVKRKAKVSWLQIATVVLLAYLSWQHFQSAYMQGNKQPQVKTSVLEGGYLVFIREGLDVTPSQAIMLRESERFVEANKMNGKRVLDKDQAEARPIAEEAQKQNIKVPFVALIADKQIKRIVPWPESLDKLKEALK